MPIVILRLELGVTKIASIICGRYIERIMHPPYVRERERERERERVIRPVIYGFMLQIKIYIFNEHTRTKKLY